jgi:type I restriction enzyme S subunit
MNKIEKLIAELCPNGVVFKTLGEVMTIVRGALPRPIQQFLTTDVKGFNWIKIGDVKTGAKYITRTAEKITRAGAEKSRIKKKGDFILSNSMSFGRP